MKKGIASEMYLAITVVVIFIVLGTLLFNIFGPIKTVDIEETKNTYVLVNALKAAKLYTESSLDFSVYQSVYNNSRHGGYYDISQLPAAQKMTNELLPLCKKYMDKYAGCVAPATKEANSFIHAGLKRGDFNTYSVGLLQCVLSRLRDESTGETYYGLTQGELKQIDCDFGEVTERGLKGFQKDHGLSETGELDSGTIDKLNGVFVSKWGDCSKFFSGCPDSIKTMVFWEGQGTVANPNEQKILGELKEAIKNGMGKYTGQDYGFMDEQVKLPVYGDADMIVAKGAGFLEINLTNGEMISITKEDKKTMERINLRISPNISKYYPIRYVDLYETAKAAFQQASTEAKKKSCESYAPGDKIANMHRELVSGFVVDAEVFDNTDTPCKLIVRVTVKDTARTYPVFNGTAVSFEPVSFEFLVNMA